MSAPSDEVTRLLRELGAGNQRAAEELMPLIHGELQRIARGLMRGQAPGHTLQATALVNEAWMKLGGREEDPGYEDRTHFLCVAARAMRSVLVDHARAKGRAKRGRREDVGTDFFEEWFELSEDRRIDVLMLNEALDQLSGIDAPAAAVVELRFFGGLSVPEVARSLGISESTVERKWRLARTWLEDQVT